MGWRGPGTYRSQFWDRINTNWLTSYSDPYMKQWFSQTGISDFTFFSSFPSSFPQYPQCLHSNVIVLTSLPVSWSSRVTSSTSRVSEKNRYTWFFMAVPLRLCYLAKLSHWIPNLNPLQSIHTQKYICFLANFLSYSPFKKLTIFFSCKLKNSK